jgi:site-specific DNA-methyltransferase (adenine-specific)
VFASPQMAWGVEGEVRKRFEVLSTPVWAKPTDGYAAGDKRATAFKARDVEALRTYFGYSERVIFAEQIGSDLANGSGFEAECDRIRGIMFAPLRDYLENTRVSCGASREECNAACGFAAAPGAMASRHYFSRSQWWLPTREHYAKIDALFQSRGAEALMSYESIRAEYERIDRELTAHCAELEHLRRPFSVSYEVPYTDVWTCPTVESYAGKHGCEKPWSMGLDIVRASSRPGDLVLDCFSGSGCFPAAAVALGRRAIACDMSPEWANVTRERCQRALENPDAASDNRRAAPVRVAS